MIDTLTVMQIEELQNGVIFSNRATAEWIAENLGVFIEETKNDD